MRPFAIPIFLGAFLLFLVQPFLAKFILPWFGGGSGVWTACLLFFQIGLLAGYAYAHGLVRLLTPRRQAAVHVAMLAVSLLFLPVVPSDAWKPGPGDDPVWGILGLLAATIGLPYIALSATSPLLQAWFARKNPGMSPYRLYALSNVGSLLPLAIYPFLVEPVLARRTQAIAWSGLFVAFTATCAWAAVGVWRAAATPAPGSGGARKRGHSVETPPRTSVARVGLWVALPAIASTLLLSSTRQLSEEIAPVPFLWIVPLVAYLLSFIVCFEWPRLYYRPVFYTALLGALWAVTKLVNPGPMGIEPQIALQVGALFVSCMVCHGELYRLRPAPERVTGFYLAIAAGGALGGVTVALVAPRFFVTYTEHYAAAVACPVLAAACVLATPGANRRWVRTASVVALLVAAGWGASTMKTRLAERTQGVVAATRNFYGVVTVVVRDPDDPARAYKRMEHGRIAHGAQILDAAKRRTPTMYFSPGSGAGRLLTGFPKAGPLRVGIVGLGAGTLAAYDRPGDVYRFYEIDPNVVRLAREQFTFLSDAAGTVEVVTGDGRLAMEREASQAYDVLILDAFAGDVIPAHLLTAEAFATYARHLAPGGAIAIHATNRYLDLSREIVPLAERLGYEVGVVDTPREVGRLIWAARYIILSKNPAVFATSTLAGAAVRAGPDWPRARPWTDDYQALYPLLR